MNPASDVPSSMASPYASTSAESLSARVDRLASILANPHFPVSDFASLRRHAPGRPPPLAFYRLWLRQLGDDLPPESQSAAWMLLTWGLAFIGAGGHRRDRPLGRALAECGYSESRLERLLAADSDSLEPLFASVVRFLTAKRESFDWRDAAHLLLITDAQKREAIHRRIASTYYRHQPRTEKE